MASILEEAEAEALKELGEEPKTVSQQAEEQATIELQQPSAEINKTAEPTAQSSDFFESAGKFLEPAAPAQKSNADIFLGLVGNKRPEEIDENDKEFFNALGDEDQYKVAQARKDIPLDDAQARRIFEMEKSKMPSVPTSWEDWYNLGGDAFDVVKNVAKIPVKVGLGAAEFGRDVVKASDMQVSDEEFDKNLKRAKSSFYSFMAPAFEIPESVLWATQKAKEGGFGWADAAGEKLGLVSPEDRFENWKGRRLVSQAQAEYFREHPTIYGRLLDSPLAKDALSYIAKSQMESPEELAKRTNISVEEARFQQDAMARQQVDQLTSEMESELPEENIRVRTAGEFLLPGEVGMGTMGAVSIGFKGTKAIAQGLKYIGKSADEIAEINKAAQALQKTRFAEMMQKRTQRAEAVARGAGKVEETMQKFKPITEKATGILGKVSAPVLGGLAGYSVSEESPMTGILTGALGGAAARSLLKGTKLGLQIPTFVREVAEARKVAPLGKTFETLGKTAEGSALKAKILSRGGKTIDNILSNSVEYARSGIHGTTLALATGALESADPEEMKQMLADGLAITLGGRALQHIKGKMMGTDPIIAQRERISDDSRIHRRYQEADPETQSNLDQISDFDNAILFRQKKLADSEIELTNSLQSNDAKKIKFAQSMVDANKKALDQVKRANVQTRNEFGREFLKTYANLQDITNGVLKTGQNNVGFNILSTDQIYQKLRNDPANNNVPDADLAQMASQAGFYSNPAQQGLVFDRKKPSIVINADSIRERINLFGESPTEALNHETSHFIDLVPEFQSALAPVRSMLFQNEIRDATGNIKATTSGLFSKAKLVELFNDEYLRHLDPQGKEAFTKLNKLWDESRGQLDENKVAEYMKSELMADLLGEVSSRHLSKDLDSATLAMWDRARIKAKKNLLDRAIDRFYGFGGRGDIVTAANTRAEFPPEAMAAARDAMRQIVALNAEISPPAKEPDMPAISKKQMMKNSALLNRFGKDSPLFKSEFKVKVFDKDGNQIGESFPVTTPNPREGTFQSTDAGFKKLSGYGDIPIEAQGLQVPEGGTLVVARDLIMQPDGVTPIMYEGEEAKKANASRKKLIIEALDTDDYGTPNRFEPVSDDSETHRGTFTPLQIQAIKDMPESLVPRTLKEHMLKVNEAIARGDGTRFIADYAAVMNDKGKYQAFSPKMYDFVPIGMHLSKQGNFLVTAISVGRIFEKMRLWNERMPGRLNLWDNNTERAFDDFVKYLNNWQRGEKGETGLDPDPIIAAKKKNVLADLLNIAKEDYNPDRTKVPKRKGDPRNKEMDRIISSFRIDHIAELLENENATKLPVNYGFAKINFMPERMEGEVAEPIKKTVTQPEQFPTPERGFYSGLQQTIDQKVQGKFASPDQLKAIISNPQNVKAEELKWSGVLNEIDRLSAENQGKVPKDKVMDYLRNEGAVKFEEVNLGGTTKTWTQDEIDALERQAQRTRNWDAYEQAVLEFEDQQLGSDANQTGNLTKYAQYQLPGGENYREVVMTMPNKIAEEDANLKKQIFELSKRQSQFEQQSPEWNEIQKQLRGLINRQSDLVRIPSSEREGYTSSHFPDIPNYVAHMRVNERTDAEGNDGLFIEELQSDRHQAGREKGYEGDILPISDAERSRLSKISSKLIDLEYNGIDESNPTKEYKELIAEHTDLSNKIEKYTKSNVPDAPFRKDWGVQLFKRALRDAVESGKSWIGWTTGDTQAERYDLSKQVDQIAVHQRTDMLTNEKSRSVFIQLPVGDGSFTLGVNNNAIIDNTDASSRDMLGKNLADVVGKEMAQKIMDAKSGTILKGDDLKIGGEGMKGFYDQILPKEIGKYVAKMGGKVEKSEIDKGIKDNPYRQQLLEQAQSNEPDANEAMELLKKGDAENKVPIWRVNITPEMAGKVKGGQLQFMPQRPAEQERIVAATYTDPRTGEVREGASHKAANPNAPDEQTDRESRYYGFKTDTGRVVDREEAYRIAEASGQLKEATSEEDRFNADRGVLHSNMVEMEPTIGEKTETYPKIGEQISVQDAIQLVAGKTEKPGGVDPATWFNENDSLELRNVPLSEITPNQEGEKYDGTVNLERAKKYSKIPSDKMPPIILVEKKRNDDGLLNVLDGGHRVSAARMRGDDSILAIVRKKPTISEKPKSSEMIGADTIKSTDIETSAKPASDAVIKPYSNALVSSAGLINFLPAYHGTPYEIPVEEGFKMSQVGTGEGAQAYGYGLYFAQARQVGEDYRRKLSGGKRSFSKEEMDFIKNLKQDSDDLIEQINFQQNLPKEQQDKEEISKLWKEHDKVENALAAFEERGKGNLYKVDLDVKDEDLLDWDGNNLKDSDDLGSGKISDSISKKILGWENIKSIEDFEQKLKEAEKEFAYGGETGFYNLAMNDARLNDLQDVVDYWAGAYVNGAATGERIYNYLSATTSPKQASEYLNSIGIPGIRYLDGTSRKQGEGTYNYVIFDENLIKILDKNDKPVAGDLPKQAPLAKGENFEVSKSGDVFVDDITKPVKFTKNIGLQFMPARPEVNLEDYIDKPIIALTADRMGVGKAYVGPKGLEQEVSQKSQGGPGFSFLYTDEKSNPIWGFTRKEDADRFVGRITSLAKKEKSDSVLVAPTLLSPDNHLHNPTGQLGYAEAINAAIKANLLDAKLADSHIEQIMQRVAAGKGMPQADKDKFSAIKSLTDFTNAVKAKEINFRQAAVIREKAAAKTLPISVDDMTRMGILPSEVAKNLSHEGFYELPTFSVVSLFEVPANQKPEKGEFHYSYPWIVRGNAIGFLKNIYNLDKLTSAENVRSKKTGELSAQPVMVVMPQLDPQKIQEASNVLQNLNKPK